MAEAVAEQHPQLAPSEPEARAVADGPGHAAKQDRGAHILLEDDRPRAPSPDRRPDRRRRRHKLRGQRPARFLVKYHEARHDRKADLAPEPRRKTQPARTQPPRSPPPPKTPAHRLPPQENPHPHQPPETPNH